jgi:hypothetical protein
MMAESGADPGYVEEEVGNIYSRSSFEDILRDFDTQAKLRYSENHSYKSFEPISVCSDVRMSGI